MRKRRAEKRQIPPDPVYSSVRVQKFINKLMRDGKKSKAEKIFYQVMENLRERTGKDPLEVFNKAIENVMPIMEVRPRRVGGATYQVPIEVSPDRAESLAMRWILQVTRAQRGKPMAEKLTAELLDAYNNGGKAIKIKEQVHRMAEANKAFAHFRW